jgi:endonuclease YncB( thermonuclease family)
MPPTVDFNTVTNSRKPAARKFLRSADGDTPYIEQPIRMVSCDTPEKAGYAGKPETSQPKLDTARQRLEGAFYAQLPQGIRDYLAAKLTADAAERHINAGLEATKVFDALLAERLTRPSGSMRSVGVIPTGEVIDRYGRMLAYLAPWYTGSGSDPVPPVGHPDRDTFNLNMIKNGWAAFFPVYGSLPKDSDMNMAIAAAEEAWDAKRGAWAFAGEDLLLAYEYRLCVKLGTASSAAKGIADAFQRECVDLRTLTKVGQFGFDAVPPPYRLWIWEDDVTEATAALGLS